MSNKTIELDYNESLDKKIISKIGNPFKCDTEALQSIMNKFYDTDKVIVGKKILVIRMLDIAEKYALNNSVIYITDNKEKYDEFLKSINEDKYGGDDEAFLFDDWKNLSEWMKVNNMPKFDIIIGNPPYSIAHKADQAYISILSDIYDYGQQIVWLCPSRWVKCSHTKQNNVLNFKKYCNLTNYKIVGNPFDIGVEDVGIFVFDKNKIKIDVNEIYFKERFSNVALAKSIKHKVEQYTSKNNITKLLNNDNAFKFICSFIRGHINNGKPAWDWTTIRSENNAKKGAVFTFASENEMNNFWNVMNTDIMYFVVYTFKDDRNLTMYLFSHIPYLKDYTHVWTEQEIANELGLTQKEVDYIHEEMKPFGWKAQPKVQKKRKSKNDYFANMND